jgi:predicted transcriptional regulator/transcriptional regulator with XRE-family HTH domain
MTKSLNRKVFAGGRIRRLRRDLGLTQSAMAEELGVSASYLNLIEGNQRPVSAQLLLKLAEVYDADLRLLGGEEGARALSDLKEVFSDPVLESVTMSRQDMADLAEASPGASQAILALYRAYRQAQDDSAVLAQRLAGEEERVHNIAVGFPVDEVRNFLHERRNYFRELDEQAEQLYAEIGAASDEHFGPLRDRLLAKHGIQTRILPVNVMGSVLRRLDRHRRQLQISELVDHAGRAFQAAYQIGLIEAGETLTRLVGDAGLSSDEARKLARVTLANYFAGALLMPYGKFLGAAQELRYDIGILSRRFGTSFEQVCHRLTTLQRQGARGVPFFMIRIDNAGNVSKRFSAGGFHFAQYGGTCPRWNLHDAFRVPGKLYTQLVEMPDGTAYFSVARTVGRTGSGQDLDHRFAVGLGCEVTHARGIAYADGLDPTDRRQITPIGPTCRLCERVDCALRAHPPLSRRIAINEAERTIAPFAFELS